MYIPQFKIIFRPGPQWLFHLNSDEHFNFILFSVSPRRNYNFKDNEKLFNLNFHTEPDINRLVLFWLSRNYSYIITQFEEKVKNKIYFIQYCSTYSVTTRLSTTKTKIKIPTNRSIIFEKVNERWYPSIGFIRYDLI